jgi:hypothetical protein
VESGVINPTSKNLRIVSQALSDVLSDFTGENPKESLSPKMKRGLEIKDPHIWGAHGMPQLLKKLESESDARAEQLSILLRYFEVHKADEYNELNQLLTQRKITRKFLKYLYVRRWVFLPKHHADTYSGSRGNSAQA